MPESSLFATGCCAHTHGQQWHALSSVAQRTRRWQWVGAAVISQELPLEGSRVIVAFAVYHSSAQFEGDESMPGSTGVSLPKECNCSAEQNLPEHEGSLPLRWSSQRVVEYEDLTAGIPDRALFILHKTNPLRKAAVYTVTCKYFDMMMLAVIIANCTTLAMYSRAPGFNRTQLANFLNSLESFYMAAFSLELVLKVLAMGLALAPGTYLRNWWNILDAVVLALGYVDMCSSNGTYVSTALRAVRVLRPLRTVTHIRELQVPLQTLLHALPMLSDVGILCLFILFVFGIVGLHMFAGAFQYKCAEPDFTTAHLDSASGTFQNVTYMLPFSDLEQCSGYMSTDITWSVPTSSNSSLPVWSGGSAGGGYACPATPTTGTAPFGMFCAPMNLNPNDGITNFDNIGWAWLTIFQCITQEGWTDVMYFSMDAVSPWAFIYFLILIFAGSFFLLQLTLAVVYLQFRKESDAAALITSAAPSTASLSSGMSSTAAQSSVDKLTQSPSKHFQIDDDDKHVPGQGVLAPIQHAQMEGCVTAEIVLVSKGTAATASPTEQQSKLCSPADASCAPSSKELQPAKHGMFARMGIHVQHGFTAVAEAYWFTQITTMIILMNTAVMAATAYPENPKWTSASEVMNISFIFYFLMEALIKLVGLGPKAYIKDGMNKFDALVVLASVVEAGCLLSPQSYTSTGAISVLRVVRVLRVFKVARKWRTLNRLITALMGSFKQACYLLLLLMLFSYVIALMGVQLYGYKFASCDVPGSNQLCPPGMSETDCPCHPDCYVPCSSNQAYSWFSVPGSPYNGLAYCEQFPRNNSSSTASTPYSYWAQVGKAAVPTSNFDNIGWALLTVFQLFTNENWNNVLYSGILATSPAAALWFICVLVLGNYMLLNLFLAATMDYIEDASGDDDDSDSKSNAGSEDGSDSVTAEPTKRSLLSRIFNPRAPNDNKPLFFCKANGTLDSSNRLGDGNSNSISNGADLSASAKSRRAPAELQPPQASASSSWPDLLGSKRPCVPTMAEMKTHGVGASVRYQGYWEDIANDTSHDHASESAAPVVQLQGTSCCLLGPNNQIRLLLARLTCHKHFDNVMLALTFITSIILALEMPNMDTNGNFYKAMKVIDVVCAVIFAVEALLKILVLGFIANGPDSYLREPWNGLDFAVAVIGVITMGFSLSGGEQVFLNSLRTLRTLRVLRVFRVASRLEGMKVVIDALVGCLPALGNITLLFLLFYLVFGIIGVDLFAGSMYSCQTPDGERYDAAYVLPPGQYLTREWCESTEVQVNSSMYHSGINVTLPAYTPERQWVNRIANFDNVLMAMLTLFSISSTELWVDTMYDGVATVGVDQQPTRDFNPAVAIYFVVFIMLGTFVVLQLFIGTVVDQFTKVKEEQGKSVLLTQQQQDWITIQGVIADAKVEAQLLPPKGSRWRDALFDMLMSTACEWCIIAVIVLNILIMAMIHAEMSDGWDSFMSYANVAFTAIFTVEAVLKMVAFGVKQYMRDGMCRFDLLVVLVSIAGIALDMGSPHSVKILPLLRTLRLVRLFRLIPKAKGLRNLLQTLIYSLPALGNVVGVLLLFFFIYAVVGMNLFGTVKFGRYLNRHANFSHVGIGLLTLFRMITGECWDGIMQDCMNRRQCMEVLQDVNIDSANLTISAGTWLDASDSLIGNIPAAALVNRCPPHPLAAVIFFCSFVLLCGFVLTNFIVGVIIDNLQAIYEDDDLPVSKDLVRKFVEAWSELDPTATYYIPAANLGALVLELPTPMGIKGELITDQESEHVKVQSLIMALDIPVRRKDKIHFLETLHALAGRVAGTCIPDNEEKKVCKRLYHRLPIATDPKDVPKHTVGQFYAGVCIQSAVRGVLRRHALREDWRGEPTVSQDEVPEFKPGNEQYANVNLHSRVTSWCGGGNALEAGNL